MATTLIPRTRLTRSGVGALVLALVALASARVFAVLELYIAGAALLVIPAIGWSVVAWRGLPLTVERWVHPPIVTVGDVGRVDLTIRNPRRRRSARTELIEPVGPHETARLTIGPLHGGDEVEATYRVPAARRGVLTVGPLRLQRSDLLGVATIRRVAANSTELAVAPRANELTMPDLGRGVLGRHLLVQAQRLGTGEFHSLREYVTGDEPRLIDWRASARTDGLKVRQNTTEGVRRCIVVLDRDERAYAGPDGEAGFERAVEAAASIVHSADRAGLTTRFVTGPSVDLRGPEVAAATLRHLARVVPGEPLDEIERDPGEGLGLVVVVTTTASSAAWRSTDSLLDPTLVRLGVGVGGPDGTVSNGRLWIDATESTLFVRGWEALTGRPDTHGTADRIAASVVPA